MINIKKNIQPKNILNCFRKNL